MVARFEFEVDTTHANTVWQAEVADNLEEGMDHATLHPR